MAANFLASADINEKNERGRRKRRSNLWLNKPKTKKRRLFPPVAEDDTSASPGDRQPALESVCKRLIKALVPASVVPGSAAVKCISWLGTRKPSINIQCLLLRWILVVYDCFDKKDGLHSLYGVIFHFLHYRIFMPYVCHLLYLLTRKEDVSLYRVRYLLQFQKDMVGLLCFVVYRQGIDDLLWLFSC
ncbi:hypothetical protein DPMN_123672 [Dreissena polymorpha]|uniref:Uncharacterized protein n=1 Tax=Dreissena polymorpha TaxID=45954 RepID=A0A9D4GRC1_DREPO|nr:hypothetical protein DPMN_123672 [Dreissena polymorpha]